MHSAEVGAALPGPDKPRPGAVKTFKLRKAIPETLSLLGEGEARNSVLAVLETLGVVLPSTLNWVGAAQESTKSKDLVCLGRFQLVAELGRGGMGRVLAARDPEIRRTVAVKVMIHPGEVSEEQLSRFVSEAQITGQLEHPNIVPVYDMGLSEDGQFYFVMKKVQGRSLAEVITALGERDEATEAEWSQHRLLTAFVQVCNAVAYAHSRGVLHRDLKPSNIMLGPFGEVLVMDWGVARLFGNSGETVAAEPQEEFELDPDEGDQGSERVSAAAHPDQIDRVAQAKTVEGTAIGTPGFMSPEQALGKLDLLDGRSDVWSLGAVLYELLALLPAYTAVNPYALVYRVMRGPPVDPCERAPGRGIPEEVAAVCMRALAPERDDRFASAAELGSAVQAFLEGSKRREAALLHVSDAEGSWTRYEALSGEQQELLARKKALEKQLPAWAPLEAKAELRAVRQQLGDIDSARTDRFAEILAACEKAYSQDPGSAAADRLLARVHYARFEEAEAARDKQGWRFHEQRVRRYDDGRYAPLLKGTGALTLRTDPPGAEVICQRYDRSVDLAWPMAEPQVLGTTPLEGLALESGSYLLTLRYPGRRDTRYPVFLPRGHHWDSGPQPIPLFSEADIGEGVVYVPASPFVQGGDLQSTDSRPRSEPWVDGFFLSVLPVTMQQYSHFVSALHGQDPEQAWSRVPRQESGLTSSGGQYWERPSRDGAYAVPERDRDGDPWSPLWPVYAVSWEDAGAYAAWCSEKDGLRWALPTEQQWEKAARGVDGRTFPWGDGFDPTLCKMRDSRQGRPQPEPVGSFAADISPYGVRDLAGGVRDWCGDDHYGGDPKRRPLRGGAWSANARNCRAAYRHGNVPWYVFTHNGFRLARPLP